MSDLGSYITNEYGLLTLIFSYLPSKDLLAASCVCKEWKDVALRKLYKNSVPKSYVKKVCQSWEEFDDKIHPKVILHILGNNYLGIKTSKRLQADLIDKLTKKYALKGKSMFNLYVDSWYITTQIERGQVTILNEDGRCSESLLMLPEMRDVNIDVFSVDMCTLCSGGTIPEINTSKVSNSKCFLLFTNGLTKSTRAINEFFKLFPNPQKLVLGGGITVRMTEIKRMLACYKLTTNVGILGILFGGENVTAHSDLLADGMDIDVFLKNFAEKVGPKPDGSLRIAFMFVCVNRTNLYEKEESSYFEKYFPSVPLFGFASLGEYCIRNPQIEDKVADEVMTKRKKVGSGKAPQSSENLKIFYEQSTAYVVITFKKG